MRTSRRHFAHAPKDLAILSAAAFLALVVALGSYVRLSRIEARVRRENQQYLQVVSGADRLSTFRSEYGDQAEAEPVAAPDLIPFLETAAARAGIPRETMTFGSEDARPVSGRPELVEQETWLDLKSVSAAGFVQLLGATEQNCPSVQLREIVMAPLAESHDWMARVRFAVIQPAGAR